MPAPVNNDSELKGNEPGEASPPGLFHVVLIEPEIPQNTGNIGRTCVGSKADLQLVGQLGFSITDRNLKRAGLDYWQHLRWCHHETVEDWYQTVPDPTRIFYFSTKSENKYYDIDFREGDSFVFGRETKGLNLAALGARAENILKIPIYGPIRSYNVATAVTVVLAEALRQLDVRSRGL